MQPRQHARFDRFRVFAAMDHRPRFDAHVFVTHPVDQQRRAQRSPLAERSANVPERRVRLICFQIVFRNDVYGRDAPTLAALDSDFRLPPVEVEDIETGVAAVSPR